MQTRLEDFLRRPIVQDAEYTVGQIGAYIRFNWSVDIDGVVYLDANDDLALLGAKRVARKFYEYHATISGGPNIVRYESPDPGYDYKRPAFEFGLRVGDHHKFHHEHFFNPLHDGTEEIRALNLEDTPTLPEFVEQVLGWYHENRQDILNQF